MAAQKANHRKVPGELTGHKNRTKRINSSEVMKHIIFRIVSEPLDTYET